MNKILQALNWLFFIVLPIVFIMTMNFTAWLVAMLDYPSCATAFPNWGWLIFAFPVLINAFCILQIVIHYRETKEHPTSCSVLG